MSRLRALGPVHIALALPWVVAIIAARRPIRDNSFLWHVTAGAFQIDGGQVLTVDPFSFTRAEEPWRTQSWLLELAYAWMDSRLKLGFVPWFLAIVTLLVLGAVGLVVYGASRSVTTTAVMLVASIWTAVVFLSPRPVIVSYLLMALVVLVVRQRRLRWVLPLLFWVWAAVHASFLVGIAYVALDGLRRRDRRATGDVIAASAVTLLTAHGFGTVEFLTGFLGSRDALDLLTEWGVPNLLSVRFAMVPLALLLLVYGGMRGRLVPRDLWVIGPMLLFMLSASRAVLPAWIGVVPFLAAAGTVTRSEAGRGSVVVNGFLLAAIAVVPVVLPMDGGLDSQRFPVDLELPGPNVRTFHDDVVGGYLVYSQRGQFPVFADDRAELYGAEHFTALIEARSGRPSWRDTFAAWGIGAAVVKSDDDLAEVLDEAGWSRTDETEAFVAFRAP